MFKSTVNIRLFHQKHIFIILFSSFFYAAIISSELNTKYVIFELILYETHRLLPVRSNHDFHSFDEIPAEKYDIFPALFF